MYNTNRDHPFEEFFVARRVGRQFKILQCLPDPAHKIEQKFPNVVRFCFPDRPKPRAGDPPMKALRFTFVLTNEFGRRMFGHVFQPLSGDLICFVSKFCWVEFFDDVFYRFRMNGESLESVVSFYHGQVPSSHGVFCTPTSLGLPGTTAAAAAAAAAATAASSSSSSSNNNNITPSVAEGLRRPGDSGNGFADVRLCSVLEFVSNDVLLRALAALMSESRIIVVGRRVADISDVVLGLVALLQPFDWEHVLIPVLPNDLLDVLCSPTPFLIGLLTTQVDEASRLPMEDVTVVVLGRSGGEHSFVRKGIPDFLDHHMALGPASPVHPHALSLNTSFVPGLFPSGGASKDGGGAGGGGVEDTENKLETAEIPETAQQDPIFTLPFTDSALCSLRLGLFQARRQLFGDSSTGIIPNSSDSAAFITSHQYGSLIKKQKKEEADETLLAAFHDYYVYTFGLVFAQDFTPQNYTVRMVMRGGEAIAASPAGTNRGQNSDDETSRQQRAAAAVSSDNSSSGSHTKEFFERVAQGMMLSDMRALMTPRLEEADFRALEIKKLRRSEAQRIMMRRSQSSSLSEMQENCNTNNNNGDDDETAAAVAAYRFRATPSDVFQIRRIINSEFLEAVLERFPLLYPHAAQILVCGTQDDVAGGFASTEVGARTVARLEDSSLLRRFVSWCSYGVTSTVAKLETRGRNLLQVRAELEES